MKKYKTVNVDEETHSHLTQIIGMETVKKKKKLSYSDVINGLITLYENGASTI